jgi:ABC-type lipoprotein release transport system permease subunit
VNAFLDTLAVVAQIALRNLFASRIKTFIVGGIIGFGALIVVLGTSLLDSVDQAMSRSITGSIAGDIQVYSAESRETLDVFGGFGPGGNDIAPLADFAQIRSTLMAVPNVSAVVPMGIDSATVTAGNTVDQALSSLRAQASKLQTGGKSEAVLLEYAAHKDHVRQIVRVLRDDFENAKKVRADTAEMNDDLAAVERANSDAFWNEFDRDPLGSLELLENSIAPLASDADLLFLRYVGTDPEAFRRAFDRMTIVEGQPIPPGQRGFLLSKYVYEEQVKLKTARTIDKVKVARDNRHELIAKEPELQRMIKENANLAQEILLQLDATKTAQFRTKLQQLLHSQQSDLGKLLSQFLLMDDRNFDQRYRFYYEQLAPSLQLYKVRVGDTLTIKAFTRTGYVQSANLRVYGIFAFKGLEKSPQAGAMNMMDLVSFRELYGYLTPDRARELRELRARSGAKDVAREDAERELFAEAPARDLEAASTNNPSVASPSLSQELAQIAGSRSRGQAQEQSYDPSQLQQGVVLNAAVFLKDERRANDTLRAIEAAAVRDKLPLRALPWQKAVGITGQFTVLMRAILYAAVVIIFVVALIIINNALVMAALERVREFGTLRAIGAQRRFICGMLVLESVVTGLLFGSLGALVGCLAVILMGQKGLPAWNDVVTFFFSGPRLYPALSSGNLVLSLAVVLIVSVISSGYPAWIAMRVSPRQAMQSEE